MEYKKIGSERIDNRDTDIWLSELAHDSKWDSFVESTAGGQYQQTSWWHHIKSMESWPTAIRLILTQGDTIIGGFQLLLRSKKYIGNIGYIPKGPVFLDDIQGVSDAIYNKLEKVVKIYRLRFVIMQPPENNDILTSFLQKAKLRRYYPTLYPLKSTKINIGVSQDEILKAMRRTKRQDINKGLRKGVTVRVGTKEDLNTLFQFMVETCKRRNTKPRPQHVAYLEDAWDVLNPLGHISLFIAEHDGIQISALLNICFNDVVYPWKFGWTGDFRELKPNAVLYWEAMKWAQSHDYHYFYFYEVESDYSASEFKVGFGGDEIELPQGFVYISNPIVRVIYSWIFAVMYSEKPSAFSQWNTLRNKFKHYINKLQ